MIRPTFLAFETAKRALSISQAGLDIVGHNISNAQTAGYTRQRVDQVSLSMNGTASKYQTFGAATYGAGAILQGIRQIRDPYLDNRYRTEATVNGELGVKQDGLTDINNIFDEIMTEGLHAKMSDLFNAIAVLGQSSNVKEHAMVVRDTANQLVQIMNKNANQLEEARAQQMLDLEITVEQDVNTLLSKIAELNKKIKDDNLYGNPSNELNDERNMLLDNLAEFLDIKVVRTPVKVSSDITVEVMSIELNNSGDPPIKLVDGNSYNRLSVSKDPKNGNAVISLLDGISGLPLEEDLSDILTKGGLKGYIDIINGEGPNSDGGNTFRGIPYYMKALDEYAQQLAEVINRVNNISQQESEDSGANYPPVLTGSATAWLKALASGDIDFGGKNTNVQFEYDGTDITATFNDADGNPKTYTEAYAPDADGKIIFYERDSLGTILQDSDGNDIVAFTITVDGAPEIPAGETAVTSQALVDAGWPPISSTGGNKNLIVPLVPTVTGENGEKPSWINTITGGVMQFSGREYDIGFETFTDPADGVEKIKATIDGKEYVGVYAKRGKIDFRDENGAVMFSVNTTDTPFSDLDALSPTNVTLDATISAKNISISQNWFDDPLYITTTKSNAPNKKEATLALDGTKNPLWLDKVSMGSDAVSVPNGAYQFYYTSNPPTTDADGNKEIAVKINGIEYKGFYKTNSTIELKGGSPEKVGLVIQTNHKIFGANDSENVATIRTDTGAMNDNINKLLTEMKRTANYSVSGISGGFQEFLLAFHAQMGLDKNLNTSLLDASLTAISAFADRRDAISAVSIDEEGINMMTYQNYYNAAARYMTTLDEALDKIINGMGVVGR